GFGRNTALSTLPTPADVEAALGAAPYDLPPWDDSTAGGFRNQLEGWYVPPGGATPVGLHNLVHVWVGGTKGAMLYGTSPNAPAFFLHHCNVDRLWADWQRRQHGPLYAPPNSLPGDPGQSLDEPMIFYDTSLSSNAPWVDPPASPSQVLDHRS